MRFDIRKIILSAHARTWRVISTKRQEQLYNKTRPLLLNVRSTTLTQTREWTGGASATYTVQATKHIIILYTIIDNNVNWVNFIYFISLAFSKGFFSHA